MAAADDQQTTNTLRIAELKDAIQRGKLVVITGTGVSRQSAKKLILDGCEIVTWEGLLLHAVHRCESLQLIDAGRAAELRLRISWKRTEELVQVAEIATKALHDHSPATYQRWLAETVAKLEPDDPRLIDALTKLGGILATLNYDSLLEKRTKRTAVTWKDEFNVSAIINGREIEAAGQMVSGVLHLHGHWQEPASVVFGSKSYEEIKASEHAQAVQQLFAMGHTMMLVGCGGTLEDPNFTQFIASASALLNKSGNPHYILCRAGEVDALQKRLPPWIHPTAYGQEYSDLPAFIERLGESGGQPPIAPATPPPAPAPGSGSDFGTEWGLATNSNQPSLIKELLLLHRTPAVEALDQIAAGNADELGLQTRFPREVISFVAAYLADKAILDSATGRAWAIVRDRETWERAAISKDGRLIMVAHPNLQFEANRNEFTRLAKANGHAVVFPTLSRRADDGAVVPLREPTRDEVEGVLKKHDMPEVEARQLATRSNGNLPLLLRYLTGTPDRPAWARENLAALLRPLALLGGWRTDVPADIEAVGALIGRDYQEWVSALFPVLHGEDPPFVHSINVFRPVSRYENWQLLGQYLTAVELSRFQKVATRVLQASDTKFDLEDEQRAFASLYGKRPEYSDTLREGLAATLALMAGERDALSNSHPDQVRSTIYMVVRDVLGDADWKRWASLGSLLTLFAEADPETYLKIIEDDLRDPAKSQLKLLFGESQGGIFGGFYHSGLLWSLEVLAWHPPLLNRVVLVLAELAKFKLPENMGNNPLATLRSIFLPWLPQSIATIDQRKTSVDTLVRAHPEIGWQLLLALLPENHSSTSPTQRPLWRRWIPNDWSAGGTNGDRWRQEENYAAMAIRAAGNDTGKIRELLEHLAYLPAPAFTALVERIESLAATRWSESDRLIVWEELGRLVTRHHRFSKTDPAIVNRLETTVTLLEPKQPQTKHQRLFNAQHFDLYESEDYAENDRLIAKKRELALEEVRAAVGVDGLLAFAQAVKFPGDMGIAWGRIGDREMDQRLLPGLLESTTEWEAQLVRGYVCGRSQVCGTDWFGTLALEKWTPAQIGIFFSLLPFGREVWRQAEALLGEAKAEYWNRIQVYPRGEPAEVVDEVEKLLENGRGLSAVRGLNTLIYKKHPVPPALGIRAVQSYLESTEPRNQGGQFELDRVIKYLQAHPDTDQETLAKLEWLLLPVLDRIHDRSPVALEKFLARQPSFFAEVIALGYRAKGTPKPDSPPDKKTQEDASRSFRLLRGWRIVPGASEHEFDAAAFKDWIAEARKLCESGGRWEVAQSYIGHVMAYAPKDPDGLWMHRTVAELLDAKENSGMIGGLVSEFFGQRGVYSPSGGKAERALAARYESMANEMDGAGFTQIAAGMRGLAQTYIREAERQVKSEDD